MKVIFMVDYECRPIIMSYWFEKDEYFEFSIDDIQEIEESKFESNYRFGLYKGSISWVDTTGNHPESEKDGFFAIDDDFELLYDAENDIKEAGE
jgi:hypothetical protein